MREEFDEAFEPVLNLARRIKLPIRARDLRKHRRLARLVAGKLEPVAEEFQRAYAELEGRMLAACSGDDPGPDPTVDPNLPELDEILIPHPGTKSVLSWWVVLTNIKSVNVRDNVVHFQYRRLAEDVWPFYDDVKEGDDEYLGSMWMVLKNREGNPQGLTAEHLHTERERSSTFFPFSHFGEAGLDVPRPGDIVGFFCSGPARYVEDRPEYHYRGRIEWFIWRDSGELNRYDRETYKPGDPEPTPTPPPPPPPPPPPLWREDYDTVNSDAWMANVEPSPRGRVHLRWAGGKVFHPLIVASNSRIWLEGDTLMAKYWGNSAWEPKDVGHYANLHFAMMVDGQLLSRVIVNLTRPANDREFSIPEIAMRVKAIFGKVPERGALCAWWRSSLDDNVRDDFFPWRWGTT